MKKNKITKVFKIIVPIIIIVVLAFVVRFGIIKSNTQKEIENVINSDIIQEIPEDTLSGGSEYDEELLEAEGFEEYNSDLLSGSSNNSDDFIVGATQGTGNIVYYSQIDGRWKNEPYTITGNKSQTIGSSGCGPTSAAMIVAGLRDSDVTPKTMANLFVKYGFRTTNNGTYTSAFKWVASKYNIEYKQVYNASNAIELARQGYYIVCSCSSGLFTTSGHYVVIAGIDGDILKIYDPYLYNGKYEAYNRKGKATVSGNTVYCSTSNFKTYGNTKFWFGFKKDTYIPKYSAGTTVLVDNKVLIAHDNGGDKVLVDNGLNQFWINRSVINNQNHIYGLGTIAFADNQQKYIVQIFDTQFWVDENSLTTDIPTTNNVTPIVNNKPQTSTTTYVLGKYVTNTGLNVRTSPNASSKIIKTYKANTRFDTKEIKNGWAKTPSGWVCLKYCTLVYKY